MQFLYLGGLVDPSADIMPEVNQIPQNVWVLTEAYHNGTYWSGEEDIEKKR